MNSIYICIFMLIFSGVRVVVASDQREYTRSLLETDALLRDLPRGGNCPGVDLVISCGNGLCEMDKLEDEKSCAADCKANVSVRSYNNIVLCDEYIATQVPQNVEEVQDIIRMAASKGMTVKPIGASHSATSIMCAEGIVLPLERLNRVHGFTTVNGQQVVETESGVTVYELSEWLHEHGMALAGLPHMGFRDVTVGGAIATGSHGSTVRHAGVISNIVAAIEFVDGTGELHYFEKHNVDSDEFRALSASLGILGVVTKVKLYVQKQFNIAVDVSFHKENKMFEGGLINQIKSCDYGQLNWFPGVGKFMRTCGKKTSRRADQGANNELLQPKIPNFIVNPFKKVLQLGACNNTLMCLVERVRYWQFKLQPPIVKSVWGKKKNRRHVVGPSHRMVSSHLTPNQQGFFQMDWEIAVPASRAQDALVAIKQHIDANKTCLPLVGVFIRFAPISADTLLAHTNASGGDWRSGDAAVFFEMPVYLPVGFTDQQFKQYEEQFVQFARMLIRDFSGRPHWGKNREWAFDLALQLNRYEGNMERFKQVALKFDPNGTFANKFSRKLFQ